MDPTITGSVTVALVNNPAAIALLGTVNVTFSNGVAAYSGLKIDQIGTYSLQASSSQTATLVTGLVSIDVTSAPATQLVQTTPPPATVPAGSSFGLTVRAEDPFGNLDPTFSGNVTIALSNNPGGGILGGTTTVKAVNGVATFAGLTLNQAGSGYTLVTSTSVLTAGTTNPFTVKGLAATQLVVTTQPPATLTAGSSFGLTVWAEDPFGNLDSTFAGNVTAGPENNPDGTTSTTVTAINGVIPFSGLILTVAGSHSLSFTATSVSLVPIAGGTNPFTVTAAAATTIVVSSPPPGSLPAGVSFGLTVSAEDKYGNVDPTFASSVAIAVQSGPNGGSLGGTTTATASKGVATFTGLTLNKVGGYQLEVTSSSGLPSPTPIAITVTVAATQWVITAQPPSSVTAGQEFGFTVAAEDVNGNVVTTYNGQITAALFGGVGPDATNSLGGRVAVTAVGGIATFAGLTIDGVATGYTLQLNTSPTVIVATTETVDVAPAAAAQLAFTPRGQPPASVTACAPSR